MATLGEDLEFYRSSGDLTDLSTLSSALHDLPRELPELVKIVQGLLVHVHWANAYGIEPGAVREDELQLRAAAATLRRALELDASTFDTPRPMGRRVFGNCRHFSTLLCALLRHQGVPARARCGFGRYFEANKNVDHWICEVWDGDALRWRRVDAQLDDLQRNALQIDFDPLDLPEDAFWVAGRAWLSCRNSEADPASFGILDMWGQWFVEGNLCRDLASLHKLELLPWDSWGIMHTPQSAHGEADFALLDRAAAATVAADDSVALRELFVHDALRVPDVIVSFLGGRGEAVDLRLER